MQCLTYLVTAPQTASTLGAVQTGGFGWSSQRLRVVVIATACCLSLPSLATAGFFDEAMSLDPVAYWRLGDSGNASQATDATGNHDGTYIGGVTLGRPGAIAGGNTAAHFDETDDYVEIPDFEYTNDEYEFSLGFWFRQDEIEGADFQYMFSQANFDQPESLNIYFREDQQADTPGGLRTHLNNNNISTLPAGYSDGEWHFYTLTLSRTDGAMIYMDGEWVAENFDIPTSPDFVFDPPTDINIGRRVDAAATRYYGGDDIDQGLLDEMVLFDFTLTEDQVQTLYEARLLPEQGVDPPLEAGDADQDFDFDQLDLVKVQIAAKYLSGQTATWGEGDWDGAPGGTQGAPPPGNRQFDQLDIIAALASGLYLTGPYAALRPNGQQGDGQTSLGYNANTGEVWVDAPAGRDLTSINIDSASGVFTGDPAQNLGGSFDNDADGNIFKATFGSSFGSLSFGSVAQTGLSAEFVASDLSVVGSLAGGGDLGEVDLIYVPEPSTVMLFVLGLLCLLCSVRRE